MISEEKMVHVLHLMIDGLEKSGMVTYPDKDNAVREARKLCFQYISHMAQVGDAARRRITTQKNPPPEHSSQWENLFHKYYEEEMKKFGG